MLAALLVVVRRTVGCRLDRDRAGARARAGLCTARRRRDGVPRAARTQLPLAVASSLGHQPRRRADDRGRSAAGCVADPRPVLVAAAAMLPAAWLSSGSSRGDGRPPRPADPGDGDGRVPGGRAGRAVRGDLTGQVNIWLVMLARCSCIGLAEVFADSATGTLAADAGGQARPRYRQRADQVGFLTANQLVGPAVGALPVRVGHGGAVHVQAVCVALGVRARLADRHAAVARCARRRDPRPAGHRRGRALASRERAGAHARLVIVAFNVTWAAPWSVLVLWSLERVGMDEAGFGLLTTPSALGGLLGRSPTAGSRRVPLATLMRAVLAVRGGLPPGDGVHDLAVGGVPADVLLRRLRVHLGDAVQAVRQRAVPTEFQGRVGSVYMLCVMGGMLIGSLLGGADRAAVGRHRAVVVRLRRLGADPGARVAAAGAHRPRRRGGVAAPSRPE